MAEGHVPGDLQGQVALVTGGSRGLGRAIALALAANGAAVGVCARSTADLAQTVRLIEEHGGRAVAITADVAQRRDAERAVAAVEEQIGALDLLVNNAGVAGPSGPLGEVDPDAWWDTQVVNVRGPLYCSSAALPGMRARRHGRIITMASGAGLGPWPMMSSYAVSKATLICLTENLAVEAAADGVVAFAIRPGIVRTAMVEAGLASTLPAIGGFFRQARAEGRMVSADRVAHLVVTLASGRADPLSGRFLSIDDNLDALLAQVDTITAGDLLTLRLRTV